VARDGDSLPNTSKNTFGSNVIYRVPAYSSFGKLSLSVDYYWRSAQIAPYVTDITAAYQDQSGIKAYGLVDAGARLEGINGTPLEILLYVKNAANKLYRVAYQNNIASLGYSEATYGDPRTFGIVLQYKF
jgi:iron complex outermembrane receptor protein